MDAKEEAKLRVMMDKYEIHQVMLRYGRGLDRLDNELLRSCYFDDAIEDHGHFVGKPDDFIAWADGTTLMFESTAHAVLNHFCDLQGDNAYTETYYLFTGRAKEPPHLMSTGRYIDHFQKRNGEWRIANRVTIIDATYGLDNHAAAALPSPYVAGQNPQTRDRNDVSYHRPPRPRKPPQK
jgi:ketosteroid isomerase-like protein